MQKTTISFILSAFLSHGVFAQVDEAPFLDIPSEGVEILPYVIPDDKLKGIKEKISKSSGPKVNVFKIKNQGAFVANAMVNYVNVRGEQQHMRSPDLRLNQVHRFEIPRLSTNIHVQAYSHTGILWDNTRRAYNEMLTEQTPGMKTFGEGTYLGITLTGTTFSPRWRHKDVSMGVGWGQKKDPYALRVVSCVESIGNEKTGEVQYNNYCDYSVTFNSRITTEPDSISESMYLPSRTSRKSDYPSYLHDGYLPEFPSAPFVQLKKTGFPVDNGFYVQKNKQTGALNIYREKDLYVMDPPSGEPESNVDWRFIGPLPWGQAGVRGDIYPNGKNDLYMLMNKDHGYFPTDKKSNPNWKLISPREWRSYDPDAIAGLIYGHNNSKNNEIELFELKRTNISYSYFPEDQSDNEDWHYLGYIEQNL